MTTQTYILCAVAGLLGIAFHLFAIKIPSAQSRAKAANLKFTVGEYFSTDYPSVIASVFTIAILLLITGEALKYKPEIQGWIITIFAFSGFAGSSILLAIFGKVNSQINKVIDVKTDVADDKMSAAQGTSTLQNNPISTNVKNQ